MFYMLSNLAVILQHYNNYLLYDFVSMHAKFGLPILLKRFTHYNYHIPQTLPISAKVIAPYWSINTAGELNYTIIKSDISEQTEAINIVNNYLAYNFSISFNADWILVAQWMNTNTSNKVCVLNTLYFNNFFMATD